jgi:hypothetical protein
VVSIMQVPRRESIVQALLAAPNPIVRRSARDALTRRGVDVFTLDALAEDPRGHGRDAAHVDPGPTMTLEAVGRCDAVLVLDYAPRWTAESERVRWRRCVAALSAAADRAGVRRRVRARTATDAYGSNDGPALDPTGWTEILTAPVYGIASDTVTAFLIMMRALPIVPLVRARGGTAFLWHEDLADAVAAMTVERDRGLVRLGGPEVVSPSRLYRRIARLIGRWPPAVAVSPFAARQGLRLAGLSGSPDLAALVRRLVRDLTSAGRVADSGALDDVRDRDPTRFEAGLRRLVTDLPEVVPPEGVGSLETKRFAIRIHGCRDDAARLFGHLRRRFRDIMPVPAGVEPVVRRAHLERGATIALGLPGRGHATVRVVDTGPAHVVLATLLGHPVSGVVRFAATDVEDGVEFEVRTYDKAANAIDRLALRLGGTHAQDANWRRMVRNTASLADGRAGRVRVTRRTLGPREAARAESWIAELVRASR